MKLKLGKTNYRQICSILKIIYQHPGVTRKELGDELSIDRAMVTHILKYLITEGWLAEQNSAEKRLPLSLVANRLYVAGVEIQPEYQELVVCDIEGTVVFKKSSKKHVVDVTSYLNEDVLPALKKCPFTVAGLGVAVPGICDTDSGVIIRSVPFLQDQPVAIQNNIVIKNTARKPDGDEYDIPVFVENDVRCWGCGKVAFEKQYDDFLVVIHHFIDDPDNDKKYKRISNGAAYFSKGAPLSGDHGCAGELPGFFRVDELRKTGNYISYEKRLEMRCSQKIQEQFLKSMAITVGYLSTVMDVETVFISGLEKKALASYEQKVRNYMEQYHFYPDLQKTDVQCEKSSKTATALGACGLVLENLFVKSCEGEVPESRLIKQRQEA